jgi:hypothetical protein
MKKFQDLKFNKKNALKELNEFKDFLKLKTSLSESKEIRPFFQSRHYLCLSMGFYDSDLYPDGYGLEYDLFGDFACDLVIRDSVKKRYAFIEFEDARDDSIFKKVGKKATKEWAQRFEHGYSQISDWFWKLNDMKNSTDFTNRFGAKDIDYIGLLVIGRDTSIHDDNEKSRLDFRTKMTLVNSKKIHCVTYDQLFSDLKQKSLLLPNI